LSGIPRRDQRRNNPDSDSSLNKAFRLAAARAGAESLIVYWGVLDALYPPTKKGLASNSATKGGFHISNVAMHLKLYLFTVLFMCIY